MNTKGTLSFTDRIKATIALVGSAEKLAYNSGMSARVIGQYLSGKTDPTRKKLIALAEAAGVNTDWLVTGVGPMKKGEREVLAPELLTVIIEGLDDLETALGKKLTYAEKAEIISHTYVLYSDADPASDQTKILIQDSIKEVYNLFSSLDGMIETEKGREQAIKIFTRLFGKALTEEKTKRAAQTLIGAKLSRLRLK